MTDGKPDKIFVTWKHVTAILHEIRTFVDGEKFDGIYGIPRGGLIPAVMLSHLTGLPMLLHPTKESLIIDDIYDTGKTIDSIPHGTKVCLFWNNDIHEEPNIYGYVASNGKWVVFPWETNESTDR